MGKQLDKNVERCPEVRIGGRGIEWICKKDVHDDNRHVMIPRYRRDDRDSDG